MFLPYDVWPNLQRLWTFKDTLLNFSLRVWSDSPFSYHMLASEMDVKWCGRLVVNWVSNLDNSALKQSTKLGGSLVNQLSTPPPLSEVGNTRHNTELLDI